MYKRIFKTLLSVLLGITISINVSADTLVFDTQKALKQLGYNPGKIDGNLSLETRRAIRNFERVLNYTVTGEPSKMLLEKLMAPCMLRFIDFEMKPSGGCRKPTPISDADTGTYTLCLREDGDCRARGPNGVTDSVFIFLDLE